MENQEEMPQNNGSRADGRGPLILAFVLAAIAAACVIYTVTEHRRTAELAASNQALSSSLSQMQNQIQALSERLVSLATPPPAAPVTAAPQPKLSSMPARKRPRILTHRMMARRQPVDDPRWKQVQSQLSDQQKELASTRDEVTKTRDDLSGPLSSTRDELTGRLSSTRDELNGSIARTHEELVALQKRGERNYYEFKLDKSKTFQRVGPVSLSLRKVNFKKKYYDLAMMVDDFQLNKKNINLYEPVWVTLTDRPQPVELVVNRLTKDEVVGYLSEPKYKKSEPTVSSAAASAKPQPPTPPQ